MIKNSNKRLQITISQKQYDWISKTAKKIGCSKTQFIKWCLDSTKQELAKNLTKEEFDACVKLARDHTWLDTLLK